jgi:hypothetical protein
MDKAKKQIVLKNLRKAAGTLIFSLGESLVCLNSRAVDDKFALFEATKLGTTCYSIHKELIHLAKST